MVKYSTGSDFILALLFFISFISKFGCAPNLKDTEEITTKNYVESGDLNIKKQIGDIDHKFTVFGSKAYTSGVQDGTLANSEAAYTKIELDHLINLFNFSTLDIKHNTNLESNPNSLLFGMPYNLLNETMLFGSAITQVSEHENVELGGLKLADLPPLNVKLILRKTNSAQYVVSIVSCGPDCSNINNTQIVFSIPVVGITKDSSEKKIILDLSGLGKNLDLTSIRQGDPVLQDYTSEASKVVRCDYSKSTLVFDVETILVPNQHSDSDVKLENITITNRWYLRSASKNFNSSFVSRESSPGVGFFLTERSQTPLIERWDFEKRHGIKYYIKHVPLNFQHSFSAAFDQWNDQLLNLLGKKLFNYEFIPDNDPRNELIIAGDPRYNVLEWDLTNKAVYGGLGPALSNQSTGEIFHANVLIQGPTIVQLYSSWFKSKEEAALLRAQGDIIGADFLINKIKKSIQHFNSTNNLINFKLNLGTKLNFRIRSQQPSLEDPIIDKINFDPVPENFNFQKYMNAYFQDMVTHELGHNLGLRHNFKGSLGATGLRPSFGKVSRSVMEYLDRNFRHLDRIGEYDLMAISYGYLGIKPSHTDWYCTDEDLADLNDPIKSAECSKHDATNDPFSYQQSRLSRAIDLLISRGKTTPPEWTVNEMKDQLKIILTGLGVYAVSANNTFSTWTNFPHFPGRPQTASEVPNYVKSEIKNMICDPSFHNEIESKVSIEAKNIVNNNLEKLRQFTADVLSSFWTESELDCKLHQI
jgi:hypothetical protein